MADEQTAPAAPADDFDVSDAPDLSPPDAKEAASAPETPATPETPEGEEAKPAEAAPAAPPNPYASELKKAGLREIAGESPDTTANRLIAHWRGKGDRHYGDLLETKSEIKALREGLDPIIRSYYRQEREAAAAAAAAQIPDKETDPEGYKIFLAEEAIRRDEARRQEEARRGEEEALAAQQSDLADIDEAGFAELSHGLGLEPGSTADPEVVEAYELLTRVADRAARQAFPRASDEQRFEFMSLAQQLDVRNWKAQGLDIREAIKQRARDIREIFGMAGTAPPASNGGAPSGEAAQAAMAATAPAPAPPPAAAPQPSPTAARIATEAAAAARRQPVTAAASSRPAGMPGQKPDPLSIEDEDDYVEAMLNGMYTEEERIAPHRRER